MRLADALYEARRGAIDDMISIRLVEPEAKAQSVAVAALLDREITAKVVAPTELDIAAWYKANPQRVQGAPIDQVREPIKNLLTQERTDAARQAVSRHAESQGVDRGVTRRTARESRRRRAADARSCCGTNRDHRVLRLPVPVLPERFPDRQRGAARRTATEIRFIYRHYPLPNHPNARPAAEAAACAAEQNKFWEYHDRLFQNARRSSRPPT